MSLDVEAAAALLAEDWPAEDADATSDASPFSGVRTLACTDEDVRRPRRVGQFLRRGGAALGGVLIVAAGATALAHGLHPKLGLRAREVEVKSELRVCERCPVGQCDRGGDDSDGSCVWFLPPVDTGAYHCRVEACDAVPVGEHFSPCWQYAGKSFYTLRQQDAPCRGVGGIVQDVPSTARSSTHAPSTTTRPPSTSTPTTSTAEPATSPRGARHEVGREQGLFDLEAAGVAHEARVQDIRLTAYWDEGTCGPMGAEGDDHHSEWCGGLVYKPKCPEIMDVDASVCISTKAALSYVSGSDGGDAWIQINGCTYLYFAQYECLSSTTTTTTTTVTTTTITVTTTTTTTTTATTTTITTTSTKTTTTTTETTTSTNAPGSCPQPLLGPDYDVSDCADIFPGEGSNCTVRCASTFHGEEASFFCYEESVGFVGEPPRCRSTTTSTTTTTTTSTETVRTTTGEMERAFAANVTEFEHKLGQWGVWHEGSGFPDECEEGFKTPAAPQLATDYNGIQLPPMCIKKKGPHRVYVIGDWGGVLGPHGPSPANQKAKEDFVKGVDDRAQQRVAAQMAIRAKGREPDYFLNAGDCFYWSGLDTKCGLVPAFAITPTGQFEWTFEHIYTGEGIEGKPWLGVLGNHDYGGYMFNKGWDQLISYTWGPGGRWVMPGQYWRTKVHYPGFSVDYYFVDTNVNNAREPHADPEHNICSKEHIDPDKDGCGKEGPKDVWDCPGWFKRLWDAQEMWLHEGLGNSSAEWQIVVTHFPPTWQTDFWKALSKKHGIDLMVTGHMHHQEFHYEDPGNFLYPTAWIISGGGGGITSEGRASLNGLDDQYGFYELTLSKDMIEIQGISHGGLLRSQAFLKPRHAGEDREMPDHAHRQAPHDKGSPHSEKHMETKSHTSRNEDKSELEGEEKADAANRGSTREVRKEDDEEHVEVVHLQQ